MINSQNSVRSNIRMQSQRKTLIILIIVAMGMNVLYFIAVQMKIAFQLKPIDVKAKESIDEKIDAATDIPYKTDLNITLEFLALYFVIKLDRIGILIFAWIKASYFISLAFNMLFPRIVRINQLAIIDIDRNTRQSDPMNGFDIAITVISLILLVVLVAKSILLFKLAKLLKRQNQQDVQQQYPLV